VGRFLLLSETASHASGPHRGNTIARRLIAVAVVVTLVACTGNDSTGTNRGPQPDDARAVVTWIDDGDTIDVEWEDGSTTTLRLLATNAPDQGECHADVALDHLIDTLKGETVVVEELGEDQFGRTLAHVFDGDRHINLEMVEMGHSLASTPAADDPQGPAILAAEDDAYDNRIGLWSASACGSGKTPNVEFDTGRSLTDPAGPDDEILGAETIAITNRGSDVIDLTDWILRDESTRHRFTFGAQATLGPGDTLIVSSADSGWDPGENSVWNNDGDMALLQLPDGTVVARWRY
jgi:micrococcal nuclease